MVTTHGTLAWLLTHTCLHASAGDIEDAVMAMVAADQQERLQELADSVTGGGAPVPAGAR